MRISYIMHADTGTVGTTVGIFRSVDSPNVTWDDLIKTPILIFGLTCAGYRINELAR
jgi:hypothetical protein